MTQTDFDSAAFAQKAELLFNFGDKLDIALLEAVVDTMNNSTGGPQRQAQEILTRFKEHEMSWTRVDAVLQCSTSMSTCYYALQILEAVVQTKWKALPREQCDGIKNFIVQLIIDISSDVRKSHEQQMYLRKLNLVLVQIVKQEWPRNWPTFISDIVGASQTNESLCMNNMRILKLLSEEIFDYSTDQMTSAKAHKLKTQFCTEFQAVFQLCTRVMETTENAELVLATLETLLNFLNWIPVGYIFETELLENLTMKFLPVPAFRNVAAQCLVEAATVPIPPPAQGGATGNLQTKKYNDKLVMMFLSALEQLKGLIPPDLDLCNAYKMGSDSDQKFIANLAMFLSAFLKEHAKLVEVTMEGDSKDPAAGDAGMKQQLREAHSLAMDYLLKISKVHEVEVFKICLDFWAWLTGELYRECPFMGADAFMHSFYGGQINRSIPARRRLYADTLSKLRYIMIGRMAKPEEVLVVENEQGEVVRETIKDTDAITLYRTMRETLVYLTHLDFIDTERIMTEKLARQVDNTEWGWKQLNTLCWAIGSISGAMMEEDEKRFLVTVIRDLLGLCEAKRGKDNKAVIASNIMYVVGQYPRFLRAHWKFLKTVVNKLFEFMHETHEGVQDMACDTFIKIAQKCKKHLITLQQGETTPFILEILSNLNSVVCDLSQPQVHVFFEACATVISAETGEVQADYIKRLMALPNSVWDNIVQEAATDVNILRDAAVVKNLANIIKTNVSVCRAVGAPFIVQLTHIYMDMLNMYKVTSENISSAVASNGEQVVRQPLIRSMRGLKTDSLTLIGTWVAASNDEKLVLDNFVPPLFDAVLYDYQRNVPDAREPEVLHTMTVFINKLKTQLSPEVPRILGAVFQCTLEMINRDMEEFPEHRLNFFALLKAVTQHCFLALVGIETAQFKLYMDSVIWGIKHGMRNVAEISLDILKSILEQFANLNKTQPSVTQAFYKQYLVGTLEHVLANVADSSQAQVAGLTYYAELLSIIFRIIESPVELSIKLNEADGSQSNVDYVYGVIATHFKQQFQHLTDDQIRVAIKGLFSYNADTPQLKEHLRDFLVQIKEHAGQDTRDLFLEETEGLMQAAQRQKQAIPGMVNPHLIVTTME